MGEIDDQSNAVSVQGSMIPVKAEVVPDVYKRQTHREALTAFAGVDPGVDESGQHKSKSNRASKVGSARLRKTLFRCV